MKKYNIDFQTKLINSTKSNIPSEIIQSMPDFMLSNPNRKKLFVSSMFLNNHYLPLFIPERGTQDFINDTKSQIQSFISNKFFGGDNLGSWDDGGFVVGPNSGNRLTFAGALGDGSIIDFYNDELTVNSINYFVFAYDPVGNGVCMFLRHHSINSFPAPQYPHQTDSRFQQDKYYWYKDFSIFLKILEIANFQCIVKLDELNGTVITRQKTIITTDNQSAALYIDNSAYDYYNICISNSLYNILPFQGFDDVNSTEWNIPQSDILKSINGFIYSVANCAFNSNIYPIESILLISPTVRVDYKLYLETGKNINFDKTVMEFYPENVNNLNSIYNPFIFNVSEPIRYMFFSQDYMSQYDIFNIQIFARLKNDNLIQLFLENNERLILNWSLVYEE